MTARCSYELCCQSKSKKWCIYIEPLSQVSKALYNDQFTPSGLEAYTACWYSFYQPRKDGKLSELQRERRSPNIPLSAEPGMEPGTLGLEGRDLTTAPTPPPSQSLFDSVAA